jgi:hypothetical protein
LGVRNQPFLAARSWQAQISYQYGSTDQMYVGDQRNDAAGPFGQPPQRRLHILNLDLAYGLSNRFSLDLTVPFVSGSGALQMGTVDAHHLYDFHAAGNGDLILQGEYWLSNPTTPSRVKGSVGLGVQAPTGSNSAKGTTYVPGIGDQLQPIDDAWQPGTGGWYLLLKAQGTAQISGPLFAYASGYYGMSLNEHTDLAEFGTLVGVPDVYSGRLGAAYQLPVLKGRGQGLVLSLGGLINGTTRRDLVGGGDLYFRRAGYEVFVAPALTWTAGRNMVNITFPVRVYQRQLDSLYDLSQGLHLGQDFVPWFLQVAYARRF